MVSPEKELARVVAALTLARLVLNITRRFTYALLPAISRQLGVPLAQTQTVVALQAGVGVTSPMFGWIPQRFGGKQVLVACLGVVVAMSVFGTIWPVFVVFAVVMVLYGVAKMIYDPIMQAYLADRVPYQKRAFAMGITELAWAGSLVIAAPIGAVLFNRIGLSAIFGAIALIAVVACGILVVVLPVERNVPQIRRVSLLRAWHIIRQHRAAQGAVGYSLLFVVANEMLFITYAVWMDTTFELGVEMLGAVTIVIAIAEVLGELLVIRIGDQFGKRRLAILGALISSSGYVVLSFLGFSLWVSLGMLFVIFVFVEVAIVASIPLFTEILPEARAVMMTSNVAAHSVGRLTGGLFGGVIYGLFGSFVLTWGIASVLGWLAVGMLYQFVEET